jgi:hypothetical protein
MIMIGSALGVVLLASACGGQRDEPEPPQEAPVQTTPEIDDPAVAGGPAGPEQDELATRAATEPPTRMPAAPGAPPARARAESRPPARPNAEEQLMGRVTVTGSEPMTFVTLQVEGAPAVRLVGDLERELRRLSGAMLSVEGRAVDAGPPARAIEVVNYEVVEIDGQRPFVGTLEVDGESHRLTGEEALRLEGVPAQLAGRVGARIWVVGPREDDLVRVQSYGVIRP